jgi:8-oxo-dGTP pyrophosphatase MutT (NUDIX family)
MDRPALTALLRRLPPADEQEAGFITRMVKLLEEAQAPFSRAHFTPEADAVLLIHHKKLNRWLQPGGHVEADDADALSAARREVLEETGLDGLTALGDGLFDCDIHVIPAMKGDPAHEHHDLRFLFRAPTRDFVAGDEFHGARWVRLEDVNAVESDASVMRAVQKLIRRR